MPYEKQTFIDHETKLTAAHLQHIEDGIAEVFEAVEDLEGLGLPVPETAEVDQVIVVSEVDDAGNIVATKAIPLPAGSSDELVQAVIDALPVYDGSYSDAVEEYDGTITIE